MYDAVQRFSRTRMVLPLRVWLEDLGAETPTYLAHTIDTSEIGCRLGGLRTELHPGQIITLQRGQHKAPFRVIWSRQLEPHENHAGLEAVDHSVNIWSANPQVNPAETERMSPSPHAPSSTTVSYKVAPGKPESNQKSVLTRARQRLAWCLGVSFVILSVAMVLYLAFRTFPDSAQAAIEPHLPAPPTAQELARLTPRPHPMPASLTKPLDHSASRMEVAEAPTGNIVYPAPDDFITGKVRLQIVIAANGLVKQIHVLSGKQPLAEAAAEAVRLWHYASSTGAGPVNERQTSVTVSFLGKDAVSLEFPHANPSAPSSKNN
jgi:Gram-negative bacterial TonB protein C-terminal